MIPRYLFVTVHGVYSNIYFVMFIERYKLVHVPYKCYNTGNSKIFSGWDIVQEYKNRENMKIVAQKYE